ncbi:response regulator transcription factor [Paenibacillus silvae]|uniref:response regulator transcription factor n=1 Tax=Paenibacillus silvae TaxID=1325358 RepID=UPI002002C1D0|nr:response regulator [Paenibacillus silvae]MCK6073278.1 response regulator [Paenibacillus silvae]MCK6149246.1 response regulator [Paenibacillus silvae]MCK6267545.1 response regulator [Paenibacillus silvae]
MIKVLIVDDDKLVRKGISSAMPWKDFDMEVVGEAGNGQKALEFLQTHPVDLMLTDLAMPVMSGIELMRAAKQLYPGLHIVVLTLHQDFDYIQEALRLGAIDYIAKVQLEKEQFEHVLQRIYTRINESVQPTRLVPSLEETNVRYSTVYVLVSQDRNSEQSWVSQMNVTDYEMRWEIERNCCMWAVRREQEQQLFEQLKELQLQAPQTTLFVLSDVQARTWSQIKSWIIHYTETEFFYKYTPDLRVLMLSMNDDKPLTLAPPQDEKLDQLKQTWFQTPWTHHEHHYRELIHQFKALQLQKGQLTGLLYFIVMEWNRLFAESSLGKLTMIHSFDSWYEVETWIKQTAASIRQADKQHGYSPEIMGAVKKAVKIIQNDLTQAHTASGLSQQLNISRSYFSQCFKELMGRTFNDYTRFVRVEKAKEYLVNTNHTIAWIAEQVGYTDEKYFSRIFREMTGLLPSEYRQLA